MFDWIPLQYYATIHYNVLLAISLLIYIHSIVYNIRDEESVRIFNIVGNVVLCWVILFMGLRPISGKFFGDTANYATVFDMMQHGREASIKKDFVFNYFMKWCSGFMDVHSFFLLIDVLYILPCFLFCRKYFGRYWFFGLFMFIGSLSFFSYGVNGLRNGLGTSFFILGLFFYDKRYLMYLSFILSYFMHASLIIPITAILVSGIYKNPKIYIYLWIIAIPLSLAGGSSWSTLFASIGFAEDRTSGYLTNASQEYLDQFSQTGFRLDFVLYSATAIFAGWYFIYRKKITDKFYVHLYGTYCISNAFWILVITAAFSNRFAYLSWFLMPAVIAYPMFRYKIWNNQYKIIGIIVFMYFMFTYFMNVIK